jgi:iron complex transport system substrate-binding protein
MHSFIRTHVISSCKVLFLLLSILILLAACGTNSASTSGKPTPTPAVDVYGTPITFPQTAPQRIITLAASMSEILGSLNLENRVIAVDFYTNYPATLAAKPKISDASGNYNVEQIVALHPDLILSSGGLTKPYDSQLKKLNQPIIDLPPGNFTQTLEQITLVGRLTKTEEAATKLVQQLQQQIDQVKTKVAGTTNPTVLLEVDNSAPGKPYVFGGGSFGDEMLQYANATNIFHDNTTNQGYPQVTDEAIIRANPQYVILTEDPTYGGDPAEVYKRANWEVIDAVKSHRVYHINVNIMQRPGPRLVQGLQCVAQTVHPERFSGPLPDYCSALI